MYSFSDVLVFKVTQVLWLKCHLNIHMFTIIPRHLVFWHITQVSLKLTVIKAYWP